MWREVKFPALGLDGVGCPDAGVGRPVGEKGTARVPSDLVSRHLSN